MARKELAVDSVAEAYLALLAERGIEYLFANAGTDFAPIVEAYAKAAHSGHAGAAAAHRDAREPGDVDGAWLCDGIGQGAGGDGACQRRHRQRAVRRLQRGARQRADPVHRRPLAADRGGHARRARHLHPLGAGDVRPGRHAARDRQMGLRAAQRRRSSKRWSTAPRDRHQRAARARSICRCRARCWPQPMPGFAYDSRRAASPHRRPAPTRPRSTRPREILAAAETPADHHRQCRPRSAQRSRRWPNSPSVSRSRWSSTASATVAAGRPSLPSRLRPDAVSRRRRRDPGASNATCRGSRAARRRRPDCKIIHLGVDPLFARYPIRGFPCDVAITGAPRLALPQLAAALSATLAERLSTRGDSGSPTAREAQRAGWRQTAREAPASGRSTRPGSAHCLAEARDPRMRSVNEYTLLPSIARRTGPAAISGRARRRGSAGAPARRSGSSSPKPDRQVIAILGDGSYLFANPVAVHHAAAMHRAAGAVRRHQQRDVGRGAARDAGHVPARRGVAQQQAAVDRPRRTAGLRAGLRRRGRLWRAGRGPGGAAGARSNARSTRSRSRSAGLAQRHLPRPVNLRLPCQSPVGHGAICQAAHCRG